ncbi:hypothetical protein Cni_G21837 [Canna indica]|uniref:Uncharacterized protein n=1 Tax=Canna indica TaxID=4628 RepID=A0AAQ3KQ96_9LILI|nr:hypothetical protein Cni_G21837 [Canna indica]
MGFLFRVRLTSFFAGATTASLAGFYLLYKDYMLANNAVSQQVKGICEKFDERMEAVNGRIAALENHKETKTLKPAELSN